MKGLILRERSSPEMENGVKEVAMRGTERESVCVCVTEETENE